MTTAQAIRVAHSHGCRFELDGKSGVNLIAPNDQIRDILAPQLRPHRDDIRAVLLEYAVLRREDALSAAQDLLRNCPSRR
jgi:hypothetical protein